MTPDVIADLSLGDLHGSLSDPSLTSMNFLNEVSQRYPKAISFAAGRPYEGFFEVEDVHRYLDLYCAYLRRERGFAEAEVRRALFQYGRTKGIIHELVARNLQQDEGIEVSPEAIAVTTGCQEAMVMVLRALCSDERDVLMVMSPAYVGITGAARLVNMEVRHVAAGESGIDFEALRSAIREVHEGGQRPRALYVVPDHSNPTGQTLSIQDREHLLTASSDNEFLILEDNPYGLFHGEGERLPTIKSLDTERRVVYLGSFAKTGLPGARVGYVVADQEVVDEAGRTSLLVDHLSKIKSMLTVNTSPIAQAVVAGRLLAADCSLVEANRRETAVYRENMRHTLDGLAEKFDSVPGVSWNHPQGGIFIVVGLPFVVDDAMLERSARYYNVIWTPMSHFGTDDRSSRRIRLSVSLLDAAEIDLGLERLVSFVKDHAGSAQ
ncbi:aminotransferase-like domain-containing protein [Streptomyces europaeiscabiei]|uniref:aminotransferase-like domain-containing protein n=1 Tax=Streptomyces europaeiscabiei TaxID=146819 RepID=UPI0029BC7281|nr:PLP-dependent aminotransferase family protein [Streptomyces europaeiscabiei]MDX3583345.1 PLP-dependent aminotransferase family protein [Streptomyces europaeiscabiei]